ncbi:MAG TPA: multifunctional CCA addition/repair protein [Casimicrobiaceae bacterium]|jgi:tRNA nucleotidyltransferase (CCA-adding enzyme)
MKTYRVGGSVRDELLGRPLADRDYVVVGATPDELLARGFRPVGRDFPVFLHPETHEEYALARTERKTGRGHQAFSFHTAPGVTLEEDLARRDLTINAMARADDGTLIDPFGGAKDLRAGILRHVSPAFAEDPLRVLRVARFAARFGFAVAPETEAIMRAIAAGGELAALTAERVWQEFARALLEATPSRFFAALRRCGALSQLFPEVDALFGMPRRGGDAEIDAGIHCMRALDHAAAAGEPLPVRYAVLASNLGQPASARARPGDRVAQSVRRAAMLSRRLKAPTDCRELARLAARYGPAVHRAAELAPAALLDLMLSADALRRPARFEQLLRACAADRQSNCGSSRANYPPAARLAAALGIVRGVDAGAVVAARPRARDVPRRVRAARLKALREWTKTL